MKPLIDPINTSDGKFHGKDKQTGDLATIVTPEYMNNDQDATRSMQREIISILTAAGINPEEATDTQLLTALKKVLITADDERVKNALQKESNLSDVTDASKALGNIGGVPTTRKINGHALSADANVTAQDIFNGQVVDIGNAVDLNTLTTPGLYQQVANDQAASGKNYPEANAGSMEVYKHAGITQVYRVYNNSRQYARTLYNGTWSTWGKGYDTNNKPAASDVDAVSATNGGTFQKEVGFNDGLWVRSKTGMYHGDDAAGYTSNNMLLKSWYGIGFYCTLPDADGKETGLTGYINTRSGRLEMKDLIIPGNYENFDARYYTRTLADQKFQPKGNYAAPDTSGVSGSVLWWKNTATGVITMMGKTANVANSGRVAFPFSFPTECYGVTPTRNSETGNAAAMQPYNVTETGWNLRIAGGGTETVMWIAMGK